MKKWIFGLLLGLAAITLAQASPPPVPLLWKAQDKAGTVYLLGSFHLLKKDDYPLHPVLDEVYAKADRLVFEVEPGEMASAATQKDVQALARFHDGRTLRQVIKPETAERLQKFLGSEAALIASDPFKPWYMSINVSIGVMLSTGLDPSLGLDQHFMRRAAKDNKPSGGLETVLEQLGAMDRAPLEEQDTMLADALAPGDEAREQIRKMHDTWSRGDEKQLLELVNESMASRTPQAYLLLNRDRNMQWLPQIRRMLGQNETTLVIVGAMHLLGDEGVVSLLRKQGIEVERVETGATPSEAETEVLDEAA